MVVQICNRIQLIIFLFFILFPISFCIIRSQPVFAETMKIHELKGPEWESYIGQTVTIEGIFVRDPLPMLVTDLNVVLTNRPMPENTYILLVGDMAERINPDKFGGHIIRVTGQVNAADSDGDSNNEEKQKYTILKDIVDFSLVRSLINYSPKIIDNFIYRDPNPDPKRWAILFSGGIDAVANHARYWNDLKFMYAALIGTLKFSNNNIAILYADGKALDNKMTVHYPATQANLSKVFTMLREHSTDKDLIFFFTTNHGGGFDLADKKPYGGEWDAGGDEPNDAINEKTNDIDLNNDGDKSDTVSWDEGLFTWGGEILDDTFQTMVADLKFNKMVIVMEQCYSGGLIHDMAQGGDRIIISAAGEYEVSSAMPPNYNFDEFSYHFTCAINKKGPLQIKVIDADTDNNNKVSLIEAFNYAISKDTRPETPWYEDSGDGIPHSGNMPNGGEGALGTITSLEP